METNRNGRDPPTKGNLIWVWAILTIIGFMPGLLGLVQNTISQPNAEHHYWIFAWASSFVLLFLGGFWAKAPILRVRKMMIEAGEKLPPELEHPWTAFETWVLLSAAWAILPFLPWAFGVEHATPMTCFSAWALGAAFFAWVCKPWRKEEPSIGDKT